MKLLLTFLVLVSVNSFAECNWTSELPILNSKKLTFQECKSQKVLRLNGIEVKPNIDFDIVHENYPEGNTLWSKFSPDLKTAVVWFTNEKYERNLWVIDLSKNSIELMLTSISEGKHFLVNFDNNQKFVITIAGMGYKEKRIYSKLSGVWKK
jgi:hypothetical protein